MAISKISFDKVYGVVMTTADGEEYGLHHVTNIWRGTELGFDADDAYYASMIGKTSPRSPTTPQTAFTSCR